MKILVAAMPFAGHATPMRAIARALVLRGHDVVAYTGQRYGDGFVAVGAEPVAWHNAPDFDDRDPRATFPQVTGGRGPRAVLANLEHVFLRTGEGQARDIVAAGPFDVLVSDHLAIGSVLAGEMTGTPVASVSLVPLSLTSRDLPPPGLGLAPLAGRAGRVRDAILRGMSRAALRRLDRTLAEVRSSLGLPPPSTGALDAFWSSQLIVAHGLPQLEYPRSDLPQHLHFVGQLAAPPAGTAVPAWWGEVTHGRRVVHVTQGTYDVDPRDLLLPTLRGLATLDVQVLAATGGVPLPSALMPANARQAAFLPYHRLLPQTSVMVTNGGWGGVLAALAAGVPLVVAGGTLDKPDIARRVAWSGAGLDLRTGSPSPHRVRAAVERVLAESSFRSRAADIGRSLATYGGADAAAQLVERLATTQQPLLRRDDPWPRAPHGRTGPKTTR